MGLDISFMMKKPYLCPHCGKVAFFEEVSSSYSHGPIWHDFLPKIGGAIPYESPTDGDERYGEDYVLTKEELDALISFTEREQPFNYQEVLSLCYMAKVKAENGFRMEINADW